MSLHQSGICYLSRNYARIASLQHRELVMKRLLLAYLLCIFSCAASAAPVSWTAPHGQFGQLRFIVSSVLPSQGHYTYGPKNLYTSDKVAWCEGVAGDGIGQWVKVTFAGGTGEFRSIYITNGYAKSARAFYDNNRIKRVRITLSNGKHYYATLRNQRHSHKIRLPHKVTVRWVKLTILSVYPGRKYRDTCLTSIMPDQEEYNYDFN